MNIKYLAITFGLFLLAATEVSAHSGRTDANGGHNCNVGACAGTYHYHNGGSAPAPYVAPKTIAPLISTPKPAPITTPTPIPEVKGETTTLDTANTQNTSADELTTEASGGDAALGFVLLTAVIGGGYWGFRKLLKK